MLAPLQDYLSPKDLRLSPLCCKIKECYFHRLQVHIDPHKLNFNESKWIASEDVNVEHLLNVVRELPPPTPREAYLPQRPEHMHKRGNDGDTEQAP